MISYTCKNWGIVSAFVHIEENQILATENKKFCHKIFKLKFKRGGLRANKQFVFLRLSLIRHWLSVQLSQVINVHVLISQDGDFYSNDASSLKISWVSKFS